MTRPDVEALAAALGEDATNGDPLSTAEATIDARLADLP